MRKKEQAARAALVARQGQGARYDAPNAPHEDLLQARRGTAYFQRYLNDLKDEDLALHSLRPGIPRRVLIAQISLRAREMAVVLGLVRTGGMTSAGGEPVSQTADLHLAATLPPHALRNLFIHSAKHLDVEWRDLPKTGWDSKIALGQGVLQAHETPGLRAQEIWNAAVDLGNGAVLSDLPAHLRAASE